MTPASKEFRFRDGKKGVAIAVRVVPRAKRDEVSAVLPDGTVRIRIKAPPVDGKANKGLIKFLSSLLKVPKRNIEIVGGETSRNKLVAILDVNHQEVDEKITSSIK
jgi:uncharacterized protein (TIGR00251 family)